MNKKEEFKQEILKEVKEYCHKLIITQQKEIRRALISELKILNASGNQDVHNSLMAVIPAVVEDLITIKQHSEELDFI